MTEAFFDPTSQETEETYFSRMAAAYVQRLAPAPTPIPGDYYDAAEAAEYMVYNYLTQTSGGSVSSEGVSGISSNYVDFAKIQAMVRATMGDYYAPQGPASRHKNPTSYPYPYFPDTSRVFEPDTWSWVTPNGGT